MKGSFSFFLMVLSISLFGQKEVYIPVEWQQGSFDYSFDRSAQSDNFIMFWGPLAGLDPTSAPDEIAFDPGEILNTAEDLYRFYIDTLVFIPGDTGLITKWKMIIVLLHTWEGIEGWAFGGNYDGQTGAMWMHPHAAKSETTLAHEFTHALQNYTWMMYPGHGFINHSYVGFFWEAHAEFMALQRYPRVARQFDISRWMNTSQFHWSSTRHHYQAFLFLEYLREIYGLELINRLWRESIIGEHPLETLMRILEISQDELNGLFADYASKNVSWDYRDIGHLLQDADDALPEVFRLNTRIIPEEVNKSEGHYKISNHRAPQDYGYNIIRLIPSIPDSCERKLVFLRFKGNLDINDDAGWKFRFVAITPAGSTRYSDIYSGHDEEVAFELEALDDDLYLVVTGAPQKHHNYDWEIGFPKIYRYPYELRLANAVPDGFQPGFSLSPEEVNGSFHPNGGGFVASTAFVSPTAWIGPTARILDFARVEHNARIEGYAVVKNNALVRDSAIVKDYALVGENAQISDHAVIAGFARVWGGNQVSGNSIVKDHAVIFGSRVFEQAQLEGNTFCWGATLHGDVRLAGDAEYFGTCNRGTYFQVQGAYGRDCDGLNDHPANIEVNNPVTPFTTDQLAFIGPLNCDMILGNNSITSDEKIIISPNPVSSLLTISFSEENLFANSSWSLRSLEGKTLQSGIHRTGISFYIPMYQVPAGLYFLTITTENKQICHKILKTDL